MADKAPESNAVYTAQIVIMEEPYVRDSLDATASTFGLSRSDLARRALRAGLPRVAAELAAERDGVLAAGGRS